MRGLWGTSKGNGAGVAEWEKGQWQETESNRGASRGNAESGTPLLAPLSSAFHNDDVLISDMTAWSGFNRPNKTFGDYWQDEGGLPEVAKVAIESARNFAGSVVVVGMRDTTIPGVIALLRTGERLTVLCVVDRTSGCHIDMDVDVERARKVACRLARDYCVADAILLFHVGARRADLREAFVSLGIPRAEVSLLYTLQNAQLPTLSVGWIASA